MCFRLRQQGTLRFSVLDVAVRPAGRTATSRTKQEERIALPKTKRTAASMLLFDRRSLGRALRRLRRRDWLGRRIRQRREVLQQHAVDEDVAAADLAQEYPAGGIIQERRVVPGHCVLPPEDDA